MAYEVGNVQKWHLYQIRYPLYSGIYRAYFKCELADALTQIRLVCEVMGWSLEEVQKLGSDRFLESDEEHLKRH